MRSYRRVSATPAFRVTQHHPEMLAAIQKARTTEQEGRSATRLTQLTNLNRGIAPAIVPRRLDRAVTHGMYRPLIRITERRAVWTGGRAE